jgi:3-oxoadipate enol-lactonase
MTLIETKRGIADVEQEGEGRDLVLLHSLLADRSAFDRVRSALAKRHRVWLLNLPGYGRSTPGGATVEDYADQVAETMAALGLPRETDVLGNGLGGFIALALAIRHGGTFDRLVLADCLAGFPDAGKGPLRALAGVVREKGMVAGLDIAILRMFPPAYIQAHPDVVEERKQVLCRMDPVTFSKLCIALTQVEFEPHLPRIQNNTLVMAGAEDGTTAPALVGRMASLIPGARFVQIPDCGHCPQIEQPETFLGLLDEFLSSP